MDYTRILSIDYGLKRIGTAISDPFKIIASPYKMIENNDKFLAGLKEIIREQNIELVVLGDPGDSESNKKVKHGVLELKAWIESLSIPVVMWDETYTSLIAAERIRDSGHKKKKRQDKGLVDINSAVILLEEYLRTV